MKRSRTVAHGIAFLLTTGGLILTTSFPAAAAACSGQPGDVNGDGFAEVVVGEVGNHRGAGAVHVLYGSPSGVVTDRVGTALDDQYFTQATPGVPGAEGTDHMFGSSAVFGDFNGDRCADLAVAASSDFSVTILYGSTRGIVTTGAQRLDVTRLGSPGQSAPAGVGDLSVADLDDDGVDDLAIGADRTEVRGGTGGVLVVYGDRAGLNRGSTRPELVTLDTPGVPGGAAGFDRFGTPLVSGDFNGDGVAELAVHSKGGLQVLKRGPNGFAHPQPARITSSTPGFPEQSREWNELGYVLAAGDVNADGKDDLAVGNPAYRCVDCNNFSEDGEGAVAVFLGSSTGLTMSGSRIWTQDSPGVDDTVGESDAFGSALAMGRLDDGPTDDLAISAVRDEVGNTDGAGSVTVLLGSPTGLTTAGLGGTRFHQDVTGLAGSPEPGDRFGDALAVSSVQSKQRGSLIIGVPDEDVKGVVAAGLIHQLNTTPAGPSAVGSRTLDVTSPGVKGSAKAVETFGSAVN